MYDHEDPDIWMERPVSISAHVQSITWISTKFEFEGKKYFVHPSVLNTVPYFKSQLDGRFGDGQVRFLLPEGCAIEAFDVLLQRLYCSGSCSLAKWLSIAVHGMSEAMSGTVEPLSRMSDVLQLSQMLLLDDISLE